MDKLKQHIQNNLPDLDKDQPKEDFWNGLEQELKLSEEKDPLKDHIEQYKDEFDLEIPGEHSWLQIKSTISRHTPVRSINIKKLGWYVAAASLVLFIIVGALLFNNRKTGTGKNEGLVKTPSKAEIAIPKLVPVDTMNEVVQVPVNANEDKVQVKEEQQEIVQTDKKNDYAVIKRKPAVQKTGNRKLPLIITQTQAAYDDLIAGQVSLIQSLPMYGESAGDFEGFIEDFKRLDKQEKRLRKAVLQKGMEENTLDELAMIYQKKLTVLKMLQREISKTSNNFQTEADSIPVFIKL